MVNNMRDSFNTDVFGVEKEAGKVKWDNCKLYTRAHLDMMHILHWKKKQHICCTL